MSASGVKYIIPKRKPWTWSHVFDSVACRGIQSSCLLVMQCRNTMLGLDQLPRFIPFEDEKSARK